MKIMGIKKFEELLVVGTGFNKEETTAAVERALNKMDAVIEDIWK